MGRPLDQMDEVIVFVEVDHGHARWGEVVGEQPRLVGLGQAENDQRDLGHPAERGGQRSSSVLEPTPSRERHVGTLLAVQDLSRILACLLAVK